VSLAALGETRERRRQPARAQPCVKRRQLRPQRLQYHRLHVRYERSAATHEALLNLACCLICFRRLQHSLC